MGFRVWGLGFRVWGLGFRVWGLGFRVLGPGCLCESPDSSLAQSCVNNSALEVHGT